LILFEDDIAGEAKRIGECRRRARLERQMLDETGQGDLPGGEDGK
jgi:hypothetical protein